jgi:glycosyltransferase involved in cell wall biosynthesis
VKLSILIATIFERRELLDKLLDVINPHLSDDVECLINCDDKFKTIGLKRNELLSQTTGDYTVFVDDDDMIPDYYVPEILKAIETNPDTVGIQGVITCKGVNPKVFKHSIQYDSWYEKDRVYYRCPNHWNPTKREIMKQVGFPEINYGEDYDYSLKVRPLLKTEVVIEKPMYYYLFDPGKSVAMKRRNEPCSP